MPSLHFPIRVPDDVLVELGEFTGHFWLKPAPAAQQQPAVASEAGY